MWALLVLIAIIIIAVFWKWYNTGAAGSAIGGATLTPDHPFYAYEPVVPPPDEKWVEYRPDYPRALFRGRHTDRFYPHDRYSGYPLPKAYRKLHWGQRKLLLTEVDFLTRFAPDGTCTVVYAGAADGRHIGYLSELFPQCIFHLYDPRDFVVRESQKIHIHQQFFTDDTAREWTDKGVLFICDIRTVTSREELDEAVIRNQEEQARWTRIMNPKVAMLKYHPPYSKEGGSDEYTYLDGEIVFQAWGPASSDETRLIVKPPWRDRVYNVVEHEQQAAYFNLVMRMTEFGKYRQSWGKFAPPRSVVFGADAVFETRLWERYMARYPGHTLHELLQRTERALGKFEHHLIY